METRFAALGSVCLCRLASDATMPRISGPVYEYIARHEHSQKAQKRPGAPWAMKYFHGIAANLCIRESCNGKSIQSSPGKGRHSPKFESFEEQSTGRYLASVPNKYGPGEAPKANNVPVIIRM